VTVHDASVVACANVTEAAIQAATSMVDCGVQGKLRGRLSLFELPPCLSLKVIRVIHHDSDSTILVTNHLMLTLGCDPPPPAGAPDSHHGDVAKAGSETHGGHG